MEYSKMAGYTWISFVLLTLPLVQGETSSTEHSRFWIDGAISTENDQYLVEPGTPFVMNCFVSGLTGTKYASIRKLLGGENNAVKVTTNAILENVFTAPTTSRYHFAYTTVDDTYTFHLNVSDAQSVDSGNYTCGITEEEGLSSIEVNVVNDVASVQMFVDDDDITVARSEEVEAVLIRTISCDADLSNPQATLQLYLGEGDDAEDITGRLQGAQLTVAPVWTHENPDVAWMWSVAYSVKLEGRLTVDGTFSTKPLSCRAKIPGYEASATSSPAITYTFSQFPPSFADCGDEVLLGYREEFFLQCKVNAEPAVTAAHFRYVKLHKNVTLVPVENTWQWLNETLFDNQRWARDGRFLGMVFEEGPYTYMKLSADTMYSFMYGDYEFVAENAAGRTVHVISVVEDPTDTYAEYHEQKNGASSRPQMLLCLVVALLLNIRHL